MTKGKKEELLKVKDLALGYDGSVIAENLSFTVSEGDYLCIVGENGSGKTTLMKTLLGLQKPLRGTITFQKNLSSGMIGWLPQQTQVQKDFPASVREIVLSGCLGRGSFHPFYTKEEKQRAQEAMERLGIAALSTKSFRTLSGGQQQRVLLARALCAAGKILLLDEPTAGLDPKVTAELYTLVRELNKSGITVIMVSHDIAAAVRCATHILHIGTFNFFGTKEAYIGSRAGRYFLNEEGGAQ